MNAIEAFSPTSRLQLSVAYPSSKLQSQHLDLLAVVYVRQSTPRQVLEHGESTELQYKLKLRAMEREWHEDRILVIDDDLGQSGATAVHRVGFQRFLAEVAVNHVGLVLGIEMSRLARLNKDWHHPGIVRLVSSFVCRSRRPLRSLRFQ